jgi:hypothetical protein
MAVCNYRLPKARERSGHSRSPHFRLILVGLWLSPVRAVCWLTGFSNNIQGPMLTPSFQRHSMPLMGV